jgi:polygalacturonase
MTRHHHFKSISMKSFNALSFILLVAFATAPTRAAETADPFTPPHFPLPAFTTNTYNVLDFGATARGLTNDTPAINQAIQKCHDGGGGTVYFPPGKYLAASIHLQSNVRLLLDKDAVRTSATATFTIH